MEKAVKYFLCSFILLCLTLPLIQYQTSYFAIAPLKSESEKFEMPTFSFTSLKSGAFQESFNSFFDHSYGGRPILIRWINQLKFFLFHQSDAPGVVVGKYNYLYLSSYTNNYMGTNFIGEAKVAENVQKLQQIQDSLKKQNVELILIFAPGKASFYSEFLPDYMNREKKKVNNYTAYCSAFVKNKLHFIDLNSWFLSQKKKSPYALYPELGVHLTPHGTFLIADTLVRYIERLKNIELPDIAKYSIRLKDSLREQEHDVEELMNLQKPLFHQPVPYFELKTEKTKNHIKPSLLAIGDSYWWQLSGQNIPSHFFKEDEFWYYNNSIYIDNIKQAKNPNNLNYGDELLKRDVLVIMSSEATYDMFPFEFIEKAYPIFCFNRQEKYDWVERKINSDKNWQNNIVQKAKENQITEKEQLMRDINFVVNTELTPYKMPQVFIDSMLLYYRNEIQKTAVWFAAVKEKANGNHISIDKQMDLDAAYAFEMDYGSAAAIEKMAQLKNEIRADNGKMDALYTQASLHNKSINETLAWEIKRAYDEQRGK